MRADPPTSPPYQAVLPTPLPGIPYLGLRIAAGCVTALDYLGAQAQSHCEAEQAPLCALLQRYFAGQALAVATRLKPAGTLFQQRVWHRLQQIPAGQVMSYGELARELDSSPRAVAGACRANPIPILIPCHRVVAAAGPGGYMGSTTGEALAIKRWLLQHEGYV